MDTIAAYLPQHAGFLPKWLLFVSVVSSLNTFQAFASPAYTGQLYSAAPVTPLSSRKFGTWTFLSSVIRMYAAYYVSNPQVYDLAMWTYGIALAHFPFDRSQLQFDMDVNPEKLVSESVKSDL
ncbi:ergosterol biosynthesis protein Erg28 [Trichophyton rubrum]|uniref:Ergosterol biosynthesis protein Erg28 n=2 Tax=Trichophyton TaxID=5550 RepID=A0A178EYW0_TRIRU|nr:ergosterol biosynthesis protein Erg28 [Trichophyton rubrum]OAL69165.1 ergosterol biosynthesis protein Erg28 [Trichophyton violaceum]